MGNESNKGTYLYSTYCGEGNGTPLQYSCLENPMDRGAWEAAVHGVAEGRIRLSDFTFTFHFHALKKEMATHSSVLAWRIPGTGEPGGLLSMGVTQSRTRLKQLSSSSKDYRQYCEPYLVSCLTDTESPGGEVNSMMTRLYPWPKLPQFREVSQRNRNKLSLELKINRT